MEKSVTLRVDAKKETGPLDHVWRFIGYDECNYTYMPEGLDLLNKFGALADGPYAVRTHFTFCTGNGHPTQKFGSTNLYTEDEQGRPVYHFEYFDKIIDSILSTKNKPFVELGFMPLDLVDPHYQTATEHYSDYKNSGWACPPKSYDKWYDLIHEVVRHLRDRHGEKEVAGWYFELWNEPDIFYWKGSDQEYFKLYDYTEKAVHDVIPGIRLGGPATAVRTDFLDAFLAHCKKGVNYCTGAVGTRLDYVSFHVKGGGYKFDLRPAKENPSTQLLLDRVKAGLEVMVKNGFGDHELVLSETDPDGWAAGSLFDNANMAFRNTEYYASYVACTYDKIAELSARYGIAIRPLAWAFFFPGERCFEGTRVFSTQGIDKAVLNLWKIYGQLGDRKLHCEVTTSDRGVGFGAFAVKGKNGETQVVVYNHHDDPDFTETRSVTLELSGYGEAKDLTVTHHRIDREHSNAHTQWLREGSPLYPQGATYAAIKARDGLEAFAPPTAVSSIQDKIRLDVSLPAHGVSFLVISKGE